MTCASQKWIIYKKESKHWKYTSLKYIKKMVNGFPDQGIMQQNQLNSLKEE